MDLFRSPRVVLVMLALAGAALSGVAAGGPPAEIAFDGDRYVSVARAQDPERIAEVFVRTGETAERFSRSLTIADQPKSTSVKQIGLGVVRIAKLRTPGLEAATFAAEGAEDRDLTVTWFVLTDDGTAVEFHAARFVALTDKRGRSKGVREYHMVAREYTNERAPDAVLAMLVPVVVGFAPRWVEELQRLDRAPQR